MLFKVKVTPLSLFTSPIESYTIFSAICWGYRILFGEKKFVEFLEKFKEKPLFMISSPLPYLQNKLYFPMPEVEDGFEEPEDEEEYKLHKSIKKLKWIPETIFYEFLKGNINKKSDLLEIFKEFKNGISFPKSINLLHAKINRLTWTTGEGGLYNESAYFYDNFIFFIYFNEENFIEPIKYILRFVPFGGNKSIGFGRKILEFKEEKGILTDFLIPSSSSKKFITLSPTFYDASFNLKESFYQLLLFAGKVENFYGRITKPILKKKVIYLKTGSVLKVKSIKNFYGELKSVLEHQDKTIYQYGFAFPLYIKNGGN